MAEEISIDELKSVLPEPLRKNVSPKVMERVNAVLGDPEVYDTYRENLLGYSHVLQHGKFKLTSYVDAVKYVAYKHMGKSSKDAFRLVFPEKIRNWESQGVAAKDQASYITAYNGSKLVMLVYEESLIPIYILNRDNYQRAINTQISLMLTAKSEMVRTTAANSVMAHLKPPEKRELNVNVRTETDSAIDALTATTQELIAQQRRMLEAGIVNAEDLAQQSLVLKDEIEEGEFEEIESSNSELFG